MSDHNAQRRLIFRLLGATVLAGIVYPLSLGPVCWTMSRLQLEMRFPEVSYAVSMAYSPLGQAAVEGPAPVRRGLKWWIGVGMPARTVFHSDWNRGVGWSNPGYTYTLWQY